jgi:hypothetical protein
MPPSLNIAETKRCPAHEWVYFFVWFEALSSKINPAETAGLPLYV